MRRTRGTHGLVVAVGKVRDGAIFERVWRGGSEASESFEAESGERGVGRRNAPSSFFATHALLLTEHSCTPEHRTSHQDRHSNSPQPPASCVPPLLLITKLSLTLLLRTQIAQTRAAPCLPRSTSTASPRSCATQPSPTPTSLAPASSRAPSIHSPAASCTATSPCASPTTAATSVTAPPVRHRGPRVA